MSRAFVKESDAPDIAPERPVSAAPNRVTPRGARLIEAAAADESLPERDRRYWAARRSTMAMVRRNAAPVVASFGTCVTIERAGATQRLLIVGEDEADPADGRIAWTGPLARALDGAEPGDEVELEAGGRSERLRVLAVEPGEA